MSTVAIIAEYNPFHNGHAYQIEKAKELTGAETVVVLMSGDFVQRGEPAVMDKYLRTEMALAGGADYVFELPVRVATASARDFGGEAVRLLHHLHAIDYLCFGGETENLALLQHAANIFVKEPESFQTALRESMKKGNSYAKARQFAYEAYTGQPGDFLNTPNNILAISYLEAIKRLNSPIMPVLVKRIGASYHDNTLQENYSSATALRAAMEGDLDSFKESARKSVPSACMKILTGGYGKCFPVNVKTIWPMLQYKLLSSIHELEAYVDVSPELAASIRKQLLSCASYDELVNQLISSVYPRSRVKRALVHILLEMKHNDYEVYKTDDRALYLRLLGFHADHTGFFKVLKESADIPVLQKALPSQLDTPEYQKAKHMYELDVYAANLYNILIKSDFPAYEIVHEYSRKIIKANT